VWPGKKENGKKTDPAKREKKWDWMPFLLGGLMGERAQGQGEPRTQTVRKKKS